MPAPYGCAGNKDFSRKEKPGSRCLSQKPGSTLAARMWPINHKLNI